MAVTSASNLRRWLDSGFHTSFPHLLWGVFLAAFLLNPRSVMAQSDPDNNYGTLNSVPGTLYTWIDYGQENLAGSGGAISIKHVANKDGGARVHTSDRYAYGNISAMIKCPTGDTTGLSFNLYTSSRETAGKDCVQDEIDFEFLGKNKSIIQANYHVNGSASFKGIRNEVIIDLGFDCTDAFHEYRIDWSPIRIKWFIDGRLVHTASNHSGLPYPTLPSFLYSSIWDASGKDHGRWAGGPNTWSDAPFIFHLSNIFATALADKTLNDNGNVPPPPSITANFIPPAPISTRSPLPGTKSPISSIAPVALSPPDFISYQGAVKAVSKVGWIVPLAGYPICLVLASGGLLYAIVQRKRALTTPMNEKGGLASLEGGGEEDSGEGSERPAPQMSWLRQLSALVNSIMPR